MLKVNELNVSYKEIRAVRNVSLSVERGEIVSLIGTNGAGKTSVLRTLSGIIKPESGSIIYNGEDITGLDAHETVKRGIVQVPEGRQVFSTMTVRENLLLGAYLVKDKKLNKKRIEEIENMFPILSERKNMLAGKLSGGEQQMLVIGRALMSGGELILLDEPSLGLAPKVVEEIFNIIIKLKQMGKTILLVEQHAQEAIDISDKVYVMETGEIKKAGNATTIGDSEDIRSIYLGADKTT
jgi:branched-chain amino acid transport system ATP-binding protein